MTETEFVFDMDVVNSVLEVLMEKCEGPQDGILTLSGCLYQICNSNNISQDEAIKFFNQIFCSIKKVNLQ